MATTLSPVRTDTPHGLRPRGRLHPRYAAGGVRAYLVRPETEYILPVRLLDISTGGLRLRLGNRPRLGAEVTVRLHNPLNNWSCVRRMTMAYSHMEPDGRFVAGGHFGDELDETDLLLLLGAPLTPVPQELEDTPWVPVAPPELDQSAVAAPAVAGRPAGSPHLTPGMWSGPWGLARLERVGTLAGNTGGPGDGPAGCRGPPPPCSGASGGPRLVLPES